MIKFFKVWSISRFRLMITAASMAAMLSFVSGCDQKQGVKVGDTPPGFSGTDLAGEYVSLGQFKGKVVVLYFWVNTCCGDNLKLLEPFYSKNEPRGLAVLAINSGDAQEVVQSFAKRNRLTFSLQADEHKMVSAQYGVFGYPTIFILDRNGVIREKILGGIANDKLESLVERQLKVTKSPTTPGQKS
jgi:peroxiredoxin